MAVINGEQVQISEIGLTDYLNNSGYNIDRVVVEVNRVIISKDDFDKAIIKNDDVIEILNFVGGG